MLDSPETAETILSVGHSNYDIVTMNASPELAREILNYPPPAARDRFELAKGLHTRGNTRIHARLAAVQVGTLTRVR